MENIHLREKATNIREAEKEGRIIHTRCKDCRGTLVYKNTGKPIPSRNMITDYYIFMEHLNRYGLKSSLRKVREAVHKRKWI